MKLNLYNLIRPLGIATYSFLLLTVLTGLFRRFFYKKGINFLLIHKILAITTIFLATLHAFIVLFY